VGKQIYAAVILKLKRRNTMKIVTLCKNLSASKRLILVVPLLVMLSCADSMVNESDTRGDMLLDLAEQRSEAKRVNLVVNPGESIQAAVDLAVNGGVIRIMPGHYYEGITVESPDIRIMGMKGHSGAGVVIENPGDVNNGINVRHGAHNFSLSNVTVQGFDRNGVFLIGVEGFDIRHVVARDNFAYGIYPVMSSNGVVSHSIASGHEDAGFYVGQASDIRLMHNVAYDNVIGIEVSNSDDIVVSHNTAYNNTAGILAALLPGRTITEINRITITHNNIYDNNLPNFAEGGLAAGVPKGSGILAVGIDGSVIEKNTVTGNEFLGIALASSVVLGMLAGVPPEAFAGVEPDPDNNIIRKNTVTGNGTVQPPIPFPASDLLWDGSGSANCWEKNEYSSSFPENLPGCS
jgi:parallel beta-helix repeat protein